VPRDIRRLEEALSETLGMEARVHMSRHGGRLTLVFSDAEQLQGMLEKLGIAL
jgi:ParB family chromosome partitioning protein